MWQLRRLSTNEALSEAGPLPNNWGPILGLHGFLEKIGDLSWVGPAYADLGWVELSNSEQEKIKSAKSAARVEAEIKAAMKIISSEGITVEEKSSWLQYIFDLEAVSLQADFALAPVFPARPNA